MKHAGRIASPGATRSVVTCIQLDCSAMNDGDVAGLAALVLAAFAWGQERPPAPPNTSPEIDRIAGLIGERKFTDVREPACLVIQADPAQPMGYAFLISTAEILGDDAGVLKACDDLALALPLEPKPKDAVALQLRRFWN